MKLNHDCIRGILFEVEENTDYSNHFSFPCESDRLSKYDDDTVLYHIRQCDLSGMFTKVHYFLGGGCLIIDLTPSGHNYIAQIRSDNNWNKTKEIAKKAGVFTLDGLKTIAVGVASEAINRALNG